MSSQEETSGLPYWRTPTPPTRPHQSPRPPPPTPTHRRPLVAAKEIQTAHNQRTFKPCHPVRPPTKTVMSCWRQLLERVTATRIMSSRPKTHPQARPTSRTLRDTSVTWRKCTRSQRERSFNSHDQKCFSPALTSSNFQISTIPRPTRRKITKTMAPRRRSTPIHLCRTHPWKTHWCPHPRLRHAHVSRPETPPFKRERDTS